MGLGVTMPHEGCDTTRLVQLFQDYQTPKALLKSGVHWDVTVDTHQQWPQLHPLPTWPKLAACMDAMHY